MASLASLASRSQVVSQHVASKCGVTCLRGVREPRAVAGAPPALTRVASLGVAERGVKMWRHLFTWRQRATWRRRTWRQNVASGAIDLRGVTGCGVKTWRHEARPPGTCLQNVSSVVGRYVHPHRRPPCIFIYMCHIIYMYVYLYVYMAHVYAHCILKSRRPDWV